MTQLETEGVRAALASERDRLVIERDELVVEMLHFEQSHDRAALQGLRDRLHRTSTRSTPIRSSCMRFTSGSDRSIGHRLLREGDGHDGWSGN